jgi:hypothetical protein
MTFAKARLLQLQESTEQVQNNDTETTPNTNTSNNNTDNNNQSTTSSDNTNSNNDDNEEHDHSSSEEEHYITLKIHKMNFLIALCCILGIIILVMVAICCCCFCCKKKDNYEKPKHSMSHSQINQTRELQYHPQQPRSLTNKQNYVPNSYQNHKTNQIQYHQQNKRQTKSEIVNHLNESSYSMNQELSDKGGNKRTEQKGLENIKYKGILKGVGKKKRSNSLEGNGKKGDVDEYDKAFLK